MGKRGPPPAPKAVLKMRGSTREIYAGSRSEPKFEQKAPAVPAWLSVKAKSLWKYLAPKLEAAGVLTVVDREALARYCDMYSRWRDARDFLKKKTEYYKTNDGFRAYPHVKIYSDLAEKLARLENQFGLTPSARSRIEAHVTHGQKDKPQNRKTKKRNLLKVG